jgi:cyclopropane fatty-acyl-phospholipid synthase-like methyltransferase
MPLNSRSTCPFDPSETCGAVDNPPPLTIDPVLVDASSSETTADQQRIEEVLDGFELDPETTILHVGVGNSLLAQRFALSVRRIDGLTVSRQEKRLGDSLRIGNYTIHVLNKHSGMLVTTLGRRYDFVVDNNPASFACCPHHLYRMFDEYSRLLRPNGRILTDQIGLAWRVGDDPSWLLTYDDLEALGGQFGLQAARITDSVFELHH